MYSNEKFELLLSDENFQDDILNSDDLLEDGQNSILKKYSITAKEFVYAKKFFGSFSFRKENFNSEEISYALKRMHLRISDNEVPLTNKKQKRIDFITWISRIAAFLAIPLLLTTIYFYQESKKVQTDYFASSSKKLEYNTFQASIGARTQVALPDGSLVWLNSGSSMTCPVAFDSKSRNVELKGEAFFEVVKNEKIPMVVTAGNLKVKVYGTKFNVNAFPDNGVFETTLVEGKVSIIPGDGKQEYRLSPGYTASYSVGNQKLKMEKVDEMAKYTGWKEGKLLFHDERFSEIINRLERWYNVDIQLTDASLGNYTLYATFFDESIEQILEIFSGSIPIQIDYPKRMKESDGTYSKRQIIVKRDNKFKLN